MFYLFNDENLALELKEKGEQIILNNSNPQYKYAVQRTDRVEEWLMQNYETKDMVLSNIICF